jgi:hypothetical protein
MRLNDVADGGLAADRLHRDPLFPCRGGIRRQAQGVDPRVVVHEVSPEPLAQAEGRHDHR